jgi:GTPase SAR1 family protein
MGGCLRKPDQPERLISLDEIRIKVLLLGPSGTGKTKLRETFEGKTNSEHRPTLGVDFSIETVNLPNGNKVRVQLWDTSGEERFQSIVQSYTRASRIILLVTKNFDLSWFNLNQLEQGALLVAIRDRPGSVFKQLDFPFETRISLVYSLDFSDPVQVRQLLSTVISELVTE